MGAAQLRAFLRVLRGHPLEPHFATMATTGMRAAELRGLCWDAVDLESGTISVRRTLVSPGSSPKAMRWQEFGKSASARRKLPIIEPAASLLTMLRDEALEKRRSHIGIVESGNESSLTSWEEEGVVFLNRNGSPISQTVANRSIKTLAKRAGLPVITQHALRHCFASYLIQMKTSDLALQKMLGHSSVAVTKGIYGHMFDYQQQEIMKGFSEQILAG